MKKLFLIIPLLLSCGRDDIPDQMPSERPVVLNKDGQPHPLPDLTPTGNYMYSIKSNVSTIKEIIVKLLDKNGVLIDYRVYKNVPPKTWYHWYFKNGNKITLEITGDERFECTHRLLEIDKGRDIYGDWYNTQIQSSNNYWHFYYPWK